MLESKGNSYTLMTVGNCFRAFPDTRFLIDTTIGEQKVHFYFFKRPQHYNQEELSHSFTSLPLPYMEGIVLICNIYLYCVIAILSGHR